MRADQPGEVVTMVERLKAIRARERLTQAGLCSEVGLSISTYKKYEARITEIGLLPIIKITNHPRFKKYALWLMTGDTAPAAGQISAL